MDNLITIIKNVENKWLNPLQEQCIKQFSGCHLPSHDHTHHYRVWKYAKALLKNISGNAFPVHEEDIERLIIAVFFHDQGMSITPLKEHGKISRQLCKTYFEVNKLHTPAHFDQVLDAIEQHDQKEYKDFDSLEYLNILKFLNIADDLDAFGIIGVYRFTEIYLIRKINIYEIPEMAGNNLRSRFIHFAKTFSGNKLLIKSHIQRYMTARNFFKDLDLQLQLIEYNPSSNLGPMGVVNCIQNKIIIGKKSLSETVTDALKTDTDFYFPYFFEKLKKEIEFISQKNPS